MGIINFSKPVTGNFIVDIIVWLVSFSSIAVGIILFTLLLKLITLPFDFFSRASMRKNSLKMEEMRPELEKLQQQYANDKALYQQKMMALYKKNGYSMFGACLPTILTLVIFIVALNGFTAFSQFQNRQYFYNMSLSYNNVIYAGLDLDASDNAYIVRDADGKIVAKDADLLELLENGQSTVTATDAKGNAFEIYLATGNQNTEGTSKYLQITTSNGYIQYRRIYEMEDGEPVFSNNYEFKVIEEKLSTSTLKSAENDELLVKIVNADGKEEKLDLATAKTYFDKLSQDNINKLTAEKNELIANGKTDEAGKIEIPEFKAFTASDFILKIQQQKAAEKYREEQTGFLWVKNIWVTDSPLSHPVVGDWNTFKSTHAYPSDGLDIGEKGYNSLTANLESEKSAPNGYFILVILTAGVSLIMQLVMSKSQKAQMELQTVDGQGKQTQKIMTIMMPIMMAFFAFMYTSAFSIYIILSNILSIGSTFGINKIVDIKFKKEKAKKAKTNDGKIRGRVYTPKQEEKKPEPKKEKKKDKNAVPENDFLSGKADGKKHIRGRLK